MKPRREIEYKWQVDSLHDYPMFLQLIQNNGAKISKTNKVQIKDQYLDTPEKFFESAQLACRIRSSDGHSELTLKSFSDPNQEIFIRSEKNIQLPHFTSKKAALTYCRKKFFRTIQPLFEIWNNRRIHTLILPCGTCAEASFDQVLMFCGEQKFRMYEIELEFKSGHLEKFKEFVSKLSSLCLKPSTSSKFEVAASHLLGDASSCTLDTLNGLAKQILKKNIDMLKINGAEGHTVLNPDVIHDTRVAARRLRAAIKTFKNILTTKAKKIRVELQKLGRVLGKKRDLDVFSEFILHTIPANSISFQKLAQKSAQCQKQILTMLKSHFYASLIESLEKLKPQPSKQNILKVSRNKIRKALSTVLEIASSIDSKVDDKTLHQLRISIKKLRYTCEFFEPIFSKYVCSLSSFIEKTKKIQDILGDHQDAITGISMLSLYKSKFSSGEFLKIKKRFELKKKRTRTLFLKIWKDYWVGTGFRQSSPVTAIELIFD